MPVPTIQTLAAVTGLIARAIRLGPPRPATTQERLHNIPLTGAPLDASVTIRWTTHQIPSIEAQNEPDLATALGVVHAHLRLAQMELMRRLATGRLAELVGPAAIPVDRTLRLMGLARMAPAIDAMLPEPTRRWADAFVAGVNHHIAHAPALPHEFDLFGIRPEPWTRADLLAIGRLAAADVSWIVFARLLRQRAQMTPETWDALWPMLQHGDSRPLPDKLAETILGQVRGSNCAVVPAACSAHGSGLIAADPHLGLLLPPLWLVAALHAPGFDAVGLMLPGLPFIALGRNRRIAWGGTNLHAQSSDIVDVAAEPLTERIETIQVRNAAPIELRLRESRFGPVVSDGLLLPSPTPLALRWVGHRPSDEMTAMLGAMRAETIEQFRDALRGFAAPGQTMLAVEAGPHGRAGRVIAAHLPRRPPGPMPALVLSPAQAWGLDDLVMGADTATVGDEVESSANDRPGTPMPVGYFFSAPDRVDRLGDLLRPPVTPATMAASQRDVAQPAALAVRDTLLATRPLVGPRQRAAWQALSAWCGDYDSASQGALVFELMVADLVRRIVPRDRLRVLSAVFTTRAMVASTLGHATQAQATRALRRAARGLRRWTSWGAVHRLGLAHPLARLPVVGGRYAHPGLPVGGSNETLNVTGHGPVHGRHAVSFGSCARYRSDLAHPDANEFVLLGGQDGWLGSANAADQVALWQQGSTINVPLTPEPARSWPHCTELRA